MSFDLVTDLLMLEVYSYYAAQLEQAGWVMLSETEGQGEFVSFWELYTEQGQTWPARLRVSLDTVMPDAFTQSNWKLFCPPEKAHLFLTIGVFIRNSFYQKGDLI